MNQTAFRGLTLSIYNDDLVTSLKEHFFHLDGLALAHATNGMLTYQNREELLLETNDIVDDMHYLKDMLGVGDSCLSRVVTENLLSILVFPILLPLLQIRQINDSNLSVLQ